MKVPRGGRHVLLVDDDPALLRLVTHWLTEGGFTVTACDSFEDAKQKMTLSPPDVLLTDVRLGAFNGLQLVILAKEQRPDIRAVVMSAYDDPMLRKEAARCGAQYLLKPFSCDAVLGSLPEASPGGTAAEI